MTFLPKTRDKWIALPLVPFKVWAVVAIPFYLLFHAYSVSQHVRYGTGELAEVVLCGYIFSVIVLLFGALVQSIICTRGEATRTIMYAVAGIILVFTFYRF